MSAPAFATRQLPPPPLLAERYMLDFGGTDLHAWRLRAEPCTAAAEIGEFHHGDTIRATREIDHPGWLKLLPGPGWVKESHDGKHVWKVAITKDVTSSPVHCARASPEQVARSSAKGALVASTGAASSSSKVNDHALVSTRPSSFVGAAYRLGDDDTSRPTKGVPGVAVAKLETTRWCTGLSYRIPLARPKDLAPRWADMEDSEEEQAPSEPKPDIEVPLLILPEQHRGAKLANDIANIPSIVSKVQEPPPTADVVVRNPRRRARNKDLLQRKNKSQLCRYISETGTCPFSATCWFAHSVEELQVAPESQALAV
eukprot:TRINITY_DN2680_c1_g3_i1.p1 TRINITY_DN2680_c1_g3~~TRINITY_DN2680_c1_g3_i1.p1  ORF type:complete len:353 (-),score=34.82 TRINITY_DN2680_c1_g3_i1:124-1065(-)